jgi:hypothetical protein
LFLGAVVKLTEISKGNIDMVQGQNLESLLDNQLSLFTKHSSQQAMFTDANKENDGMKRAALPDRSKNRLKSINERVCSTLKIPTKGNQSSHSVIIQPIRRVQGVLWLQNFSALLFSPRIVKNLPKIWETQLHIW